MMKDANQLRRGSGPARPIPAGLRTEAAAVVPDAELLAEPGKVVGRARAQSWPWPRGRDPARIDEALDVVRTTLGLT
jgi:hypothetical protein